MTWVCTGSFQNGLLRHNP